MLDWLLLSSMNEDVKLHSGHFELLADTGWPSWQGSEQTYTPLAKTLRWTHTAGMHLNTRLVLLSSCWNAVAWLTGLGSSKVSTSRKTHTCPLVHSPSDRDAASFTLTEAPRREKINFAQRAWWVKRQKRCWIKSIQRASLACCPHVNIFQSAAWVGHTHIFLDSNAAVTNLHSLHILSIATSDKTDKDMSFMLKKGTV